jgi:hypothetical protein
MIIIEHRIALMEVGAAGPVHLVAVLRKRFGPLSAELHKCSQIAARGMKKEIEFLLQSAVSELSTHFPQNEFSLLAQRVPWDLIQIFNKMYEG